MLETLKPEDPLRHQRFNTKGTTPTLQLHSLAALSSHQSQTAMTDLSSFHLFSQLPTEVRLEIFRLSLEPRSLQLGVDGGVPFPYPKLAVSLPVPVSTPSLFSVCHQSRKLCLSEYVPFGYTYIHTQLDTLYICRRAAQVLNSNAELTPDRTGLPIYCIAMFNRVAIEYGIDDLPGTGMSNWENWNVAVPPWLPAHNYIRAFERFGAPKEILLVKHGRTPVIKLPFEDSYVPIVGWQTIELVDLPDEVDYSQSITSQNLAWTYIDKALQYLWKKRSAWLHWRFPILRVAEARREGMIIMRPPNGARAYEQPEKHRRAARHYNGNGNEWHLKENPYDRKSAAKALAQAGFNGSVLL